MVMYLVLVWCNVNVDWLICIIRLLVCWVLWCSMCIVFLGRKFRLVSYEVYFGEWFGVLICWMVSVCLVGVVVRLEGSGMDMVVV